VYSLTSHKNTVITYQETVPITVVYKEITVVVTTVTYSPSLHTEVTEHYTYPQIVPTSDKIVTTTVTITTTVVYYKSSVHTTVHTLKTYTETVYHVY